MGIVRVLIGLLVVIAVSYGAFQIVPPELNNYSFQDDLQNIAMTAGSNPRIQDADVMSSVMTKAQSHGITLAEEQITVQRIGTPGAPAVYVAADYSVPVNLMVYNLTLHFTPNSGNRGF